MTHRSLLTIIFSCALLSACGEQAKQPKPKTEKKPQLVLKEASFAQLPDWGNDNFIEFVAAFTRSCTRIAKNNPKKQFGVLKQAGKYADWQKICKKFEKADKNNFKTFFESNFTPFQVNADENPVGLFTGYYEASLKGSREKVPPYTIPLHARPDDLVMVHLGQFREDLKGVRIAGRVKNGTLKPYETREKIVEGNWPHEDQVLVWVDNPVDAFFVQIQGSGIVTLENESATMRIGYAGQNGHPYYAIGRELIKIGALTKEEVSLQTIRKWLEENPDQADKIMNTNKSYVFFRELKGDGPLGAEGIALTPKRSLAVDRTLMSYGLPLWVDIEHPKQGEQPIRQMMVAQDTGGAIRGPVRGDFFWGYGDYAESMAGIMKSQGRYWVLLPNSN